MKDQTTLAQICADVAARYRTSVRTLRGRSYIHGLSIIRREAMTIAFATRRYTKAQIGDYFDGRSGRCVEKLLGRPEVARRPPIGPERRARLGWASPEGKEALQHAIRTACAEMGEAYGLVPDMVLCGLYDRVTVKARRGAIALVLTRTECPVSTLATMWGVDRKEIQRVRRAMDMPPAALAA